ncbi:hypothetical protein Pcinc_011461 [Petrolisthes cinctipes]|uniref:Uncharacterized protein n=1 Tax=Petrolisthes cinctipes TaxID=88211 RepID=A0AAE1G184_PETCI|nr:hypothetical protein Pcinc_011461 [Petrolisthes cinctipes]
MHLTTLLLRQPRNANPTPLATPHISLHPCPSRNATPTPLATAHTSLPLYATPMPLAAAPATRNATLMPLATSHISLHPCPPCKAKPTPSSLPRPRNNHTMISKQWHPAHVHAHRTLATFSGTTLLMPLAQPPADTFILPHSTACTLLWVEDLESGDTFLIDSGSEVSIVPPMDKDHLPLPTSLTDTPSPSTPTPEPIPSPTPDPASLPDNLSPDLYLPEPLPPTVISPAALPSPVNPVSAVSHGNRCFTTLGLWTVH